MANPGARESQIHGRRPLFARHPGAETSPACPELPVVLVANLNAATGGGVGPASVIPRYSARRLRTIASASERFQSSRALPAVANRDDSDQSGSKRAVKWRSAGGSETIL